MSALASFSTPTIYLNDKGWGPTTLPSKYEGVPFAPFSRSENVGRVADFVRKQQQQARHRSAAQPGDEDDPDAFELVDNVKDQKQGPRRQSYKRRGQNAAITARLNKEEVKKEDPKGKKAKYLHGQHTRRGKQFRRRNAGGRNKRPWRNRYEPKEVKEASVNVRDSWQERDVLDLNQLSKTACGVPIEEVLKETGTLMRYDDNLDRVTARAPKALRPSCESNEFDFVYPGTLDDPDLVDLVAKKQGNVYATDEILSLIMTMNRGDLPWDLVVYRVGDLLIFDKRDDSGVELLSTNETSNFVISDKDKKREEASYNRPEEVAIEATGINQSFLLSSLVDFNHKGRVSKKCVLKRENPTPFKDQLEDDLKPQPSAYAYKRFSIPSSDLKVVCRTELHARVIKGSSSDAKTACVFALNEVDSKLSGGMDWRQKIDSQRGAVFATELKNNSARFGRWTARALLADADYVKFGLVSRRAFSDSRKHVLLGTQTVKPKQFASQINLSEKNCWGMVKAICDVAFKFESGKYVLMRDPNKASLKFFKVPDDEFERDDDSDDSDSDSDDFVEGIDFS